MVLKLTAPGQAYISEGRVGEEREAFEQVLVVVVLDHRRPVGLRQKRTSHTSAQRNGAVQPNEC